MGSLIVAASAAFVSAQQGVTAASPATKSQDESKARVVAELAAAGLRSGVKNAPFSAEEVNESVQTLADGNRIVRSTTGKFYRNSEGRVRRENPGGVSGVMGSVYTTGQGVSILNPTVNQKYLLDTELKTARVMELGQAAQGYAIAASKAAHEADQVKANAKMYAELANKTISDADKEKITRLQTELKASVKLDAPMSVTTALAPLAVTGVATGGYAYTINGQSTKYETRTEELGTRDFEGVSAEGTRKTTIIPAGAIGNERPIEVVYERWYSKDLGLVVYSKNTDPRFGEQTYKLINVVRAEPDPSLFSLPTGYKVITDTTPEYRLTPTRATSDRSVERTPAKVAPTSVSAKPVVKSATPVVYKKNFVD